MKKHVLITGASSGIGHMAALEFARRGFQPICVGTHRDRLNEVVGQCQELGVFEAQAYVVDLASSSEIQDFFNELSTVGGVNLRALVNCAGIGLLGNVQSISVKDWNRVFQINVTAAFQMIQGALPFLQKAPEAAIVNVSSIAGRSRSLSLGAHYSASKAALIGMTRHLAAELGPLGVRINVICPSQTKTPMLEEALTLAQQAELAARIPLRRLAEADEPAKVIAFLCGPESSYIHGAVIDVNGGQL